MLPSPSRVRPTADLLSICKSSLTILTCTRLRGASSSFARVSEKDYPLPKEYSSIDEVYDGVACLEGDSKAIFKATMAKSAEPGFGDDLQNQINLRHNMGVATFVRIFASLLAGLVAGILGVTGWIGFTYYFVSHLLVVALLWQKTGGSVEDHFPSKMNLLLGELFGSTTLLTFILFWTLANNFIHLF